jgi:hypothetical protein
MKASLTLNGYMLIDDKKATVEQIDTIIAERDNALAQNAELVAQVELLNSMFADLRDYHVCNFHTENPFIGRVAVHKNWRLISDIATTKSHMLHSLVHGSWLDGFHASNEGFNGEYREDEQLPNVLAKCFADGICSNPSEAYQQHLLASIVFGLIIGVISVVLMVWSI